MTRIGSTIVRAAALALAAVLTSAASSPLGQKLRDAADKGDLAAVKAALADGAPVDARDPATGDTALFASCADNSNARVVAFLLKRGAKPNAHDAAGETPLMLAAKPDIVRALLKAGAAVDAVDANGWTPLIWAASRAALDKHFVAVARVLLKAGADPSAKNKDGESALSLARKSGPSPLAKLLQDAAARRR